MSIKEGLSPQHHGELNSQAFRASEAKSKRLEELRKLYAKNKLALRQIDIYDGDSPYQAKLKKHVEACRLNDVKAQARLRKWFAKHGFI